MTLPYLEMVAVVTPEQGDAFADKFLESARSTGIAIEAFARAGVMKWPSDAEDDSPVVDRHHAITDEIIDVTLAMVKPAIAEAFLMVATVILARERNRQT